MLLELIIKMEPLPDKNKNKKLKFTEEEKQKKFEHYEKFVTKYPKGQLCTYFLRGLCWHEKCQFAHGIDDIDLEMHKQVVRDKKAKTFDNCENVSNLQKPYYINNKNRNYHILYEFQQNHKHLFQTLYTLDQINEHNMKRRVDLRRQFHKTLFEEYCHKIFKEFKSMTIEEFEHYFECLGFNVNYRNFTKKLLFQKSETDKKTKIKRSIIKMIPSNQEMFQNFVEVILVKLKEDIQNNVIEFPLNFKYLNNIINKNIAFEKPLIFNYLRVKNISAGEFMKEISNDENFLNRLKEIFKETNRALPEKLFLEQNFDDLFVELKENFWDKYLNSTDSSDSPYGFMNFNFIINSYLDLFKSQNNSVMSDATYAFMFKKIIFYDKNFFFTNNNNTTYVINLRKTESFDLETYFESDYDKRCSLMDTEVQKEYDMLLSNEELMKLVERAKDIVVKEYKVKRIESIESKDGKEIKDCKDSKDNVINQDDIEEAIKQEKFKEKEIILIDNQLSFYYFIKQLHKISEISVDIEGKLSSSDVKINLIQIYDHKTFHIYVFDIHTMFEPALNNNENKCNNEKNGNNEKRSTTNTASLNLQHLVKLTLTYLFENNKILKVFHDGRGDNYALHKYFNIHVSNYIDTSCIFSAIKQFNLQHKFWSDNDYLKRVDINTVVSDKYNKEFNELFSGIQNSVNPGLNKVLESYESNKNINIYKNKFHEMFKKEENTDFFTQRPIDNEFLIYSALDVKYLFDCLDNMKKEMKMLVKEMHGDVKMVEVLLLLLSYDHLKGSCEKANDVNIEKSEK